MRGDQSSFQGTRYGAPQGSVLGPFLFNVYVNALICIDNSAQFVLYADDTSLFLSSEDATDLFSAANAVLDKLREWSKANCLKINTKKSKAVLFTPKNKTVSLRQKLYLGHS